MPVHMFRCFIGRGGMSTTDLETAINDWVQSNAEWENDSVDHTVREYLNARDEIICHTVDARFIKDNTKSNLFQKFTDKLENKVDWYRVAYHNCTHDEDEPPGCSFDANEDSSAVARQWADKDITIPAAVPNFPQATYDNSM